MKYTIFMTAVALASLTGNAYWLNNSRVAAAVLDSCAKRENVYKCALVPVPAESPRVVTVQADILPPPVMN